LYERGTPVVLPKSGVDPCSGEGQTLFYKRRIFNIDDYRGTSPITTRPAP